MGNLVVENFARSLVGGVVSEDVIKEVIRISYAVASVVVYGMVSLMREGNGTRLSLVTSLSRVFRAGFMRDIFEVLIASQGDGDDAIDAAGVVAEAFLIKVLYGNEGEGVKPRFLNPVRVDHDVYMAVYGDVRGYIEDFEDKNNVAFGLVGNVISILLTVIIILLIIGMCQGVRSEGYPDGVREFLDYALTQGTHMALSEMLSHG
ncbi:MAG: hypothetical protein ACP5NQ_04510 [Vulcanisaeta sp.]